MDSTAYDGGQALRTGPSVTVHANISAID